MLILLVLLGSTVALKPLLYAVMMDDGELLPNTLVPDIPQCNIRIIKIIIS
jgi:membrane carboxypeptidase/penicillin-binding protein PbpC